ncbi:unnamed protein product [Caenorhabditis angaria]|uniref:C2H2-type domain-containing protein n=1 Tax=Caenorhabditis angaria TaxID=860376 RepID=A0A9P1I691_9PELO|nr:unnamed protein product [Caenorhabditis angaria]
MNRKPPQIPAVEISSDDKPTTSTTENQNAPNENSLLSPTAANKPQNHRASEFIGQLQHPPLGRRPVSAMASLPWLTYQSPRDDPTIDDDEDCAVESTLFLSTSPSFPSPMPGSVSSLALSPPGLSPLNFNDGSPFSLSSTPSSTSSLAPRNRFTFDHIPFIGSSSTNSTPAGISPNASTISPIQKSAFEIVSSHQNAEEILQRVRLGTSGSSSTTTTTTTRTSQSLSTSDTGSTENRQYYCNMCKKDFKRPDILSRHLRRHTGEKPFGCDACGRFFSRSDHLRTHRRTHTDEKPYPCTICNYSARRRDVLTRHMATRHHTNAPPTTTGTHRNVRRCLSDGDYHRMTIHELRQRHQTNREDIVDIPKMEDIEDDVIVDDD